MSRLRSGSSLMGDLFAASMDREMNESVPHQFGKAHAAAEIAALEREHEARVECIWSKWATTDLTQTELAMQPDPTCRPTLPEPPRREDFADDGSFHEANGHWASHVGRIRAIVERASCQRATRGR